MKSESTEVAASTPKLRKCVGCGEMFELPNRRGRPPVRCPDCRERFTAEKDTAKTTTQRIATKRAAPKKVRDLKPTVVSEEISDNARVNYEESKNEVRALKQTLANFGWHVVLKKSDAELRLSLTASRGNEVLTMVWKGGKLTQHLGGEVTPKA